MGLTRPFIQAHIQKWEAQLTRGNRPYRRNWPTNLFRHEPLESAVEILKSQRLLSRTDSAGRIARDIAPPDIIQHRNAAHSMVRLYFRPKNPTQYHMEGIRKPNELYHGRQAPVLILFIFRALDILTAHGISFSDGNMQSDRTIMGSSEQEFNAIPFDEVYHEGVFDAHTDRGQSILRRRCAEVLLPSPLGLEGNLHAIMCRSPAERATLLYLLEDARERWAERIRTYTEPGLFENTYAYVDTVDGSTDGLRFSFHPRRDGLPIQAELWITGENYNYHFGPHAFDTSKKWIVREQFRPGTYEARLNVEGCLAHHSVFLVDDLPF